ncbi:nuclear transport factor 2 family protein [Pseudonocardia xishanensis]|uniref:Nuclear transport factor 2 family protein n=1 Tax=Pseudonocardia xishanensis TaxID=630995 RepID=A0ABP8RRU8_9PSEU
MPSTDEIRTLVLRYVDLLQSGTGEELASLFADDAVVEDPIGTEPKVGHQAILAHYSDVAARDTHSEMLALRVVDNEAAANFRVAMKLPDGRAIDVEPIDTFVVDERSRITSLRVYLGDDEIRVT